MSRRASDDAIISKRVTVNGEVALMGQRVKSNDVVRLDGKVQRWQTVAKAKESLPALSVDERALIYLKYNKPPGVTCTTDMSDSTNIISHGRFDRFPQRLFTVGRLDKETSGLILLTSDGRVNDAVLHRSAKLEKVYEVTMSSAVSSAALQQLQEGVVISTPLQRDARSARKGDIVTARTLPCRAEHLTARTVRLTLVEGRNRQIRRMAEAVGLEVDTLIRVSFAGVHLGGLRQGEWADLDEEEMRGLRQAIATRAQRDQTTPLPVAPISTAAAPAKPAHSRPARSWSVL